MLGLADRRNQRIIAESRQHVFVILNERFHCGTHLVVDRRIHGNHHTGAERPIKRRDKRHALRQRIRNHGGLLLGCVAGVGGLGGGNTYGLANYCYTGVYFDATPPDAHPHNYPRQAMFHEYGHCLGYNHSSTMTYGDQWTVLCATVFVNMGKNGKLPVCSKEIIAQLPM